MARPLYATAALALLGVGCSGDTDGVGVIKVPYEEERTAELTLQLDSRSTEAGETVGYVVNLDVSDGTGESLAVLLDSDAEANLHHDDGVIRPTVAGDHRLAARTTWDGQELVATASLTVEPAPLARIDLQVSDVAFPAGGSVEWQVEGWDRFGNLTDAGGASVTADSSALQVEAGRMTGTVPGAYSATAALDGITDTEVVVVLTGEPESVELTLSDTDLEVFETTHATVDVRDAYGNPVYPDWTLSAFGGGLTVVSGANVTFFDEGAYTVRVDVDDTGLFDELGPLLIDSTGPDLDLDDPSRGGWNEGDVGVVSGTVTEEWSGLASLTVNGESVTPASDGTFSHDVVYDFGTNVVETEAVDGDGNASTDTRAVLAGEFLAEGDPVSRGMEVRLNEGAGGLGTLEALGEGLIQSSDLSALIPSPVVSQSSQSCFWVPFVGTQCITWYSVNLYVTNPSFGSTDLVLDPLPTGVLRTTFSVYDILLNWSASGRIVGVGWSASGAITADAIDAVLALVPRVSAGRLEVDLNSTTVSTTNFTFDMNGSLYDVLSFFGLDSVVSGAIAAYLEGAIEDVVQDEVPDVLDDALSDLEIAIDLPIQGNTYALDATPYDVDVNGHGLTLELSTTFEPAVWSNAHTGHALGSLHGAYVGPRYASSPGTVVGMSQDFLNQALYGLWGGGLLDMTLTSGELGLDPADLAFLFPGLTQLTITTEALLPPVVVPGTGAELLDLQVGDLLLTLYNGDAATGTTLIEVYVTAYAGLDVAVSGANLETALGGMDLYFDVVVPEANGMAAADTEALLGELVPLILPFVTDALGEIPIPDIQGFTLSNVSVTTGGAADGYVLLGGDLTQR